MAMEALAYGHFSSSYFLQMNPIQRLKSRKYCSRIVCCERGKEKKQEKMMKKKLIVVRETEKIGKGLKDNNSKQNGDWKDVVLMSFSFAVYVYISQQLVCAYCAWNSYLKHSW
ncbi:uncharacterized protein [Euphorbia lathyris]|uniref:uncharacterized protein n=1 Tax=Euphorbia lathyris TaxID=212925 RepID=UPI00331382F8